MIKIAFALAAAGAVLITAPLLVGTVPAKAQSLKMAQGVDVQVGCSGHIRDRTWPADHVRGTLLTFRASWQSDL